MKWILLSLCILSILVVLPQASAFTTTRYQDYNDTSFGNGTHSLLFGLPPRLPDGAGHYTQDYYFYNNTSSYTIATGFGTYVYNLAQCGLKFYPPVQSTNGVNASISSITHTIFYSLQPNANFVHSSFTGFSCTTKVTNTGKQLTINGTFSNTNATFSRIYTVNAGSPIKITYNLTPKISGYYWRITEAENDIPNIIRTYNGTFTESAQYAGNTTVFFITNSVKSNPVNTMSFVDSNGQIINYNFQTSINALTATGIKVNQTTGRTWMFNTFTSPNVLNATNLFTLDPTFGYSTGSSIDYRAGSNPGHTACLIATNALGGSILELPQQSSGGSCDSTWVKFDIHTIPPTSVIQTAKLKYDYTAVSTPDTNQKCTISSHIVTDPAAGLLTSTWNAQVTDTVIKDNDAQCDTGSSNTGNTATFPIAALNDIQTNLGLGWYSVVFKYQLVPNGPRPVGSSVYEVFPANVQIQINYTNPQTTYIHAFHHDGTTALNPGTVRDVNSTKIGTLSTNSTGFAGKFIGATSVLQNFTTKDSTTNFVVNKTYNYNPTTNKTISMNTLIFPVNCASDGASNDIRIEANDTDGHRISQFTTPSCATNNTISWTTKWTANGQNSNTYLTQVYGKILNVTAFGTNPQLFYNGTFIHTTYNSTTNSFISDPITVGTGLQTRLYNFNLRLLSASLPTAPTPLTVAPSGDDKITLTWTTPSSSGSYPLEGYQILRNNTVIVNDTHTPATLTYQNTGILANHKQTYEVCAWNLVGCGAFSNQASGYTYTPTLATAKINYTVVGDMIGVQPRIILTQANPNPMVKQIDLYNKTTLVSTIKPNQTITNGTTTYLSIRYHGILGTSATSNYTIQVKITNATGADKTFTTNATGLVARGYTPTYFTATDPTQGSVNYTISRVNNNAGVLLQVNRDKNAALFQIECLYQTADEIAQTPQQAQGGQWDNHTNVGYYKNIHSDFNSFQNLYISCYNDGLLFTTTSYANATLLAGINYLDTTFQGFSGVPTGIFFIALVAGLATGRTAPTIVVVILAIAAIMGAIGFFTITQPVWGLCLIAAALCMFAGKKFL